MFNLEQSITEWRTQMLAAGIKSPAPLEELESHLREEIERLMLSGIHEQQAFEEAFLKIGPARELKTEFFKVNWLRNFLRMELFKQSKNSIMIPAFCLAASNLVFGIMVICKLGEMPAMTFPEHMSAVTAMFASNLLFSSGFLGRKLFPVISGKRARLAISAFLTVLIGLWMMIFLAHINSDMGRFMAAFCWAFFVPMGALGGLNFGLEIAAQKRISS